METLTKNKALFYYFLTSLIFLSSFWLISSGTTFIYDWGWPIFDMKQFWNGLIGDSSFGLFSALSKIGPAIFGLFGLIHFPPSVFLKLFIFLVHFIAGYGFYKFIKSRMKLETVAIISGLAYAFSSYIFIRGIVGFVWSMVAYAVLPIFILKYLKPKKKILDYLIIGFLFSLIFGQTQTGLLTVLIITIYLIIGLFSSNRMVAVKNYFLTLASLFVFALPWFVALLLKNSDTSIVSGGTVTTLNFIAALPHSFRNFFMLSDHHITSSFFYPLSRNKIFLLGWLIVWFVAFCAIFNKKNRELVWTLIVSCLIVLPFIKGPLGVFGKFYVWFFNHVPQIAVFRETYHFEFLFAIALCVLFAFGLDWLWEHINALKLKVESEKSKSTFRTGLKALFAGSAIFIVAPYLTFDYAGYFKLQKIPTEYAELHNYFQGNQDVCHKIYYPPGLGFMYFKDNNQSGIAANFDTIASSLGVPYLSDGTSVLNTPSEEMFYRNELVSEFYKKEADNGEFSSLSQEGNVDCVILRLDTETKYQTSSNLWQEKDPKIVKKWVNTDLKSLIESKQGLMLDKQFGENIWIYKINDQDKGNNNQLGFNFQSLKLEKTGLPTIEQFNPSTALRAGEPAIVTLRLTDWADVNSYYKNGWSRGRYDFWRKHLFTQLRQDFIYTDKKDSILTGKIDKNGDYELWTRHLTGGTPGELEIKIQNTKYKIQKDSGEEKFVWKKLDDIHLDGKTDVQIKNITGENAIADLVLVGK